MPKVNPDLDSRVGLSPLWGAAERGHVAVCRLLLESDDVDLGMLCNTVRTLLWWASSILKRAVNLVQARQSANPNAV